MKTKKEEFKIDFEKNVYVVENEPYLGLKEDEKVNDYKVFACPNEKFRFVWLNKENEYNGEFDRLCANTLIKFKKMKFGSRYEQRYADFVKANIGEEKLAKDNSNIIDFKYHYKLAVGAYENKLKEDFNRKFDNIKLYPALILKEGSQALKDYIPYLKRSNAVKKNMAMHALEIYNFAVFKLCKDGSLELLKHHTTIPSYRILRGRGTIGNLIEYRYNPGERKGMRNILAPIMGNKEKIYKYINEEKPGEGKKVHRREDRMSHYLYAQQFINGFEVIDYQIPTTNGDSDKIDLLLKRDDIFYITETKKFADADPKKVESKETMLRCVLEIQTYYQKLNDTFFTTYGIKDRTKLKKAVLVDKDSLAWEQRNETWAVNIRDCFDIELFELSINGANFKICHFEL